MQPASDTKHIPTLTVDFGYNTRLHIQQDDQDNHNREPSTGNTLWIGGQVLAAYIQQFHPCKTHAPPQRVIELGSGVGLTAYVMFVACSWGPAVGGPVSVPPRARSLLPLLPSMPPKASR